MRQQVAGNYFTNRREIPVYGFTKGACVVSCRNKESHYDYVKPITLVSENGRTKYMAIMRLRQ